MAKLVFEGTEMEIENLKTLIKEAESVYSGGRTGKDKLPKMKEDYQTGNLWTVGDMENYNCKDEQALEVLESALTCESTMSTIWDNIDYYAEEMGLKRNDE